MRVFRRRTVQSEIADVAVNQQVEMNGMVPVAEEKEEQMDWIIEMDYMVEFLKMFDFFHMGGAQ